LQGVYRTRIAAVLAAAVGMSVTSFVGAAAAYSTPALVAATALVGYAVGTIGQMGPIATTVATNSCVAFIIFSSQPLPPSAAAQDSALVFTGGLIQATLILLAWPFARRGAGRVALADVYRKLAAYARTIGDGSPGFPPITPLATARQVLADPQPFAGSGEIARLARLLEDAEIIRRRLGALAALPAPPGDQATLTRIAQRIGARLDDVADLLSGARRDVEPLALSLPDWLAVAGLADLEAHVRDALEAAAILSTGRIPTFDLLSKAKPGPYVDNHVAWFGRDSLRFALVLATAMALGRHFQADRGYWIPLTAALVLKPDLQTTFLRGFARIGGTLVGAVVASVAAVPLRGNTVLQTAGILVTSAAAYLTFNPNYALFTVAITSFVVIVLGTRGLPGTTAIEARLLDTLAGGALAMIGYLVLPTWEHRRTRALLADLLEVQRRLAGAILREQQPPSDAERRSIDTARDDAWKLRTMVESSIDRTRREPHRPHTIGAGRAVRILAASQRFALANLAVETALETQRSIEIPELHSLAAALDATMAELAAALRESRPARLDGRLAAIAAQLERDIAQTEDPARRYVIERLLAYAEATDRIARLVGMSRPVSP
jgi:hypothetical protein